MMEATSMEFKILENDLVSWTTLDCVGSQVTMQGTMLKGGLSINGAAIYFDTVGNLTAEQLSNAPYQGGYDAGTTVGEALPNKLASRRRDYNNGVNVEPNRTNLLGEF